MFPVSVQAVALETEENHDFSGKSQYYKLSGDQNKNKELIRITEQEFESFVNQRSAVYVEGWEAAFISAFPSVSKYKKFLLRFMEDIPHSIPWYAA